MRARLRIENALAIKIITIKLKYVYMIETVRCFYIQRILAQNKV